MGGHSRSSRKSGGVGGMPTEIVKAKSGSNPRSFGRGNGAGPHQQNAIGGRGRVGERGAEGAEDAGDLPEEGLVDAVVHVHVPLHVRRYLRLVTEEEDKRNNKKQ